MEFLSQVLLKGGPVALILGCAIALKFAIEGVSSWRKSRQDGGKAITSDAATTNAMLLNALKVERSENSRLQDRIDELDHEVEDLRDRLFTQRREYEDEISNLRKQIHQVTRQLDDLQLRLRAAPDPRH